MNLTPTDHRIIEAREQIAVAKAEMRTAMWLGVGTSIAVLLALIPWMTAVSAAMIPMCVVQIRSTVVSWRAYRERRRRTVQP